MRSLQPPVVDDEATYFMAASVRQVGTGAELEEVADVVLTAYDTYAAELPGAVPAPLPLDPTSRNALRTNYPLLRSGASLSWLRADVLAVARNHRCPYCDSAQVTSLDHYLPRAQYPEYSILSTNLVPCCLRCNVARNDALYDVEGGHLWHAYLDPAPEVPILFATLMPGAHAVGAVFHVANPHGVDAVVFGKLKLLFVELGLAAFFQGEAANHLTGLAPVFSSRWLHEGNAGAHAQAVTERARELAHYGLNSWPAALTAALAEVADFDEPHFDQLVRSPVIL